MSGTLGDVTGLLQQASRGNKEAFDQLFPLVYDELKALARAKLKRERVGHTLSATALVHEAYLVLVDQTRTEWQSRAQFFAVAARAMRRILMNYARMKQAQKRGGAPGPGAESGAAAPVHVPLDEAADLPDGILDDQAQEEILALDEALEQLALVSPEGADVVQYRIFGGLSHDEIAEVLGTSEVTVRRRWRAARSFLRQQLDPSLLTRAGSLFSASPAR